MNAKGGLNQNSKILEIWTVKDITLLVYLNMQAV